MNDCKLKTARKKLGLSQSEMANAMNVPVKTIQRWELTGTVTNSAAEKLIDTMIWFHLNNRFDEYLII